MKIIRGIEIDSGGRGFFSRTVEDDFFGEVVLGLRLGFYEGIR